MDNPTTLLVAIMFVTIVVTGLVNILMCLSNWVAGNQTIRPLHASWLFFLLITHLNYFWNTTLLLEIEGWKFLSFVGFILGPIALLFATNLVVVVPEGEQESTRERYYFEISRRFFILLVLVQAWLIAIDYVFDAVGNPTYLSALMAVVFLTLAISKERKVHMGGALVVWVALLFQLVHQSLM